MSNTGEAMLTRGTGTNKTARARVNGNDTSTGQDNGRTNKNAINNRRKDKKRGGKGRGRIGTEFCGGSTNMNGPAFQIHVEQKQTKAVPGRVKHAKGL